MPGRTTTVLNQFRTAGLYPTTEAPVFRQNGGVIPANSSLVMNVPTAPLGHVIHYTVNGSDPRSVGGNVSPTALSYTSAVTLNANSIVRARTRLPSGDWSALQEAFFQLNTSLPCPVGAVVPSEIHFNPTNDDDAEFIELMNVSTAAVNLRGCRFDAGISFTFSPFFDTLLIPGQRIVLVDSEFAHRSRYGWDRSIAGIYSDNLSNGGETVSFVCGAAQVFSVSYQDHWHPLADSGGPSLILVKPTAGMDLNNPAKWRPSQAPDGNPGVAEASTPFIGTSNADTDGDGANALLEYALGTPDTDASLVPGISFENLPGTLGFTFAFTQAAAADDATVIPEASTDLAQWDSSLLQRLSETRLPDGRIRVLMQATPGLLETESRIYLRVRAELRP
jgi:hypothetical protein